MPSYWASRQFWPAATASQAGYPSPAGKWQVGSFTLDGGFSVTKALPVGGGGVSFPFLDRPDTAIMITASPAYKGRLLGDLTGSTLAARIGVDVTPGSEFEYFGEPDGSGQAANVRLYFETDTSLGAITCPCQDKGWGSFWYSDPVRVDLQTLESGDATLSAVLSPGFWSDGQEQPGDKNDSQRGIFAEAATDVDHVGLSFGGGRHFHNGVGIRAGTGSGSFRLLSYEALPR